MAESLTFSGDNYAIYSLDIEGEESGARRRRQDGLRATYEEQLSLWLRTTSTEGVVFYMGGTTDLTYIQVGGAQRGVVS